MADSDAPVEQATANPGEKRQIYTGRSLGMPHDVNCTFDLPEDMWPSPWHFCPRCGAEIRP